MEARLSAGGPPLEGAREALGRRRPSTRSGRVGRHRAVGGGLNPRPRPGREAHQRRRGLGCCPGQPGLATTCAAPGAGIRPTTARAAAQPMHTTAVPSIATGRPTVTDMTPISGG